MTNWSFLLSLFWAPMLLSHSITVNNEPISQPAEVKITGVTNNPKIKADSQQESNEDSNNNFLADQPVKDNTGTLSRLSGMKFYFYS